MNIQDYIEQVKSNIYSPITSELFDSITEEGWIEQLAEFHGTNVIKTCFHYTTLSLSEIDKTGLINFDDDALEKFNTFDIELKKEQVYPFNTLDFINYNTGTVLIIKFNYN